MPFAADLGSGASVAASTFYAGTGLEQAPRLDIDGPLTASVATKSLRALALGDKRRRCLFCSEPDEHLLHEMRLDIGL